MRRPSSGLAALALPLIAAPAAHAQRSANGTLYTVRQVVATHASINDPAADTLDFERAEHGEELVNGEAIKTLKRSYAELALRGGTTVRLNSQSIVRYGAPIRLAKGSLWASSARQPVEVQTQQVRAVGAAATFVVVLDGDEATRVIVLSGKVDVFQGTRKATVPAGSSYRVEVKGKSIVLGGVDELDGDEKPVELGGAMVGWWRLVDQERGLGVFPGTRAAYDLRTSPLTEVVTAIGAIPPTPQDIAKSPSAKAKLLSIARQNIVPKLEQDLAGDASLTVGNYASRFGSQAINDRFPVGGNDLAFLLDHGVGNVTQLFQALGASGAGFGLDIRSVPTRAVWRPSALIGAPNEKFRLFDGAEHNLGVSLAGVALGLLAERGNLDNTSVDASGSIFGMSADPQAFGARGTATIRTGRTEINLEGNLVRLLSGSSSRTYDQVDSVFSMEREVGGGARVFIGRKRFLAGPTFQNAVRNQLIADRYTGAGVSFARSGTDFQLAYLTDANADAKGQQGGALATASRKVGAGLVGVQALRVPKLRNGNGVSVSAAFPTSPDFDVYGEVGRGPDSTGISTVGVYLPSLYQASDIDVFIEYGSHDHVGRTLSIIAAREFAHGPSVRAFASLGRQPDDHHGFTGGIAFLYPFGKK